MERVTIEEQEKHLDKIDKLAKRIKDYESSPVSNFEALYLDKEELDTIKRALACHMAVIVLDMKKHKEDKADGGDR